MQRLFWKVDLCVVLMCVVCCWLVPCLKEEKKSISVFSSAGHFPSDPIAALIRQGNVWLSPWYARECDSQILRDGPKLSKAVTSAHWWETTEWGTGAFRHSALQGSQGLCEPPSADLGYLVFRQREMSWVRLLYILRKKKKLSKTTVLFSKENFWSLI